MGPQQRNKVKTPLTHIGREATNLLAARFHSDLSLGNTRPEVLFKFALRARDEGVTTAMSAVAGGTKASFHPDGRSKMGSSPRSSDLIDIRTSSSSDGAPVPILTLMSTWSVGAIAADGSRPREMPKAALNEAGEVERGVSSSSRRAAFRATSSMGWLSRCKSNTEWRYKCDNEKESKI